MKNFWKKWSKRKPAESLVEVVIALFVVATGSAAATTLIVSAIQANSFSKDNLIALNLAVEGVEGVRAIRDTNWIRFGFNKEDCWNIDPDPFVNHTCTPPYAGKLIPAGTYSADLNIADVSWFLRPVGAALDLNSPGQPENDQYLLSFFDVDNPGGNEPDMYVPQAFLDLIGIADSGQSKFYRMVEITYPDTGDPETAEIMDVVVTVQWIQNGVHQVQLSTSLSNYQIPVS